MIVERPETDKVRYVDDLTAFDDTEPFVHTVEVSDERSRAHFVTFFTTQKTRTMRERLTPLIEAHDLRHHDPSIYHLDDEHCFWVDRHFDRKMREGWTNHFHWIFPRQPGAGEVAMVLDALGDGIAAGFAADIMARYEKEAA